MTKNFVLSFGLLCLVVACTPLRSQSITGAESNPYSDCTDDLQTTGGGCPQMRQLPLPAERGYSVPATLGPAVLEAASPSNSSGRSQTAQMPPQQPTEFQKFVAGITGQFLPLYGEELFRQVPSTFSPNDQAPVPPTYVIGPDDELRIRIWGQISFSGNVRVDRSGNIYLPQVGKIQVAALQFSELDRHLRAAVARIYRNFDLSVEIGRIRSIQIYVSGQARRPGAYTISSLSTLVDALFATGGPSSQGSLRDILLKREGKTIVDFDLYALLIQGDKSKDVKLLPEDVLYIPPAGREVAIAGSVRNPGIYEVREGETIGNLIEMAGKTSAVASNARISLDRMAQQQRRRAMELDFNSVGLATQLEAGDILRVVPILPAYDKTVTLRGNIANPGHFAWHEGMRLSDLIPDQESLLSRDYWWERSHLGLPSVEFESTVSSLGQDQRPQETSPRGLTTAVTQDTLTSVLTPKGQNSVAADAPLMQRSSIGTLAASDPESRSPRNAVGLIANQINWNYAVIERIDPQSLHPSLIPFDLGKLVMEHDAAQNLALNPGDTVTVFSQSDIKVPLDEQVKYVRLEGEFVHPGYYSVLPGETLRDVARRAGGLTPRAYLYGSELTRESARIIQQQRLDDYARTAALDADRGTQSLAMNADQKTSPDLAESRAATEQMIARLSQVKATGRIVFQFRPDSSNVNDVPAIGIENGDKFVVPFAPAYVSVVGAVYDQNSFVYQPGHKLGYYLHLAGGSNRNADWRHAFLIRADGSVVSRSHFHGTGLWKESFENVKLNAGDTLVVPDKALRPAALRGLMDWSQVFSQLALGAAAVNVL